MRFLVLLVLFWMTPSADAADRRPDYSLVYDTKENSGLSIKCADTASPEAVTCEFKQISIFKKAKETELQKKVEEARQQFRSARKDEIVPKDCSSFENTLSYMRGQSAKISANEREGIDKLTGRDRQDIEQVTAMLVAFCRNPNEENALNMARYSHQKDARTCRILTSNFSQTFQRVTADAWVSKEGPGGLCGVVRTSRLERVGDGKGFWVYTESRVVSNKRSSTAPEFCKGMDESEHFFDWKGGGDRFVGCEYIEMGF